MPQYLRLKNEKDFNLVFKKGKKLFSSRLTLYYITAEQPKVAFTVSKKHGGSVKRNRIKRILRESFRSFAPQISQNFFFVFVPKICDDYSYRAFLSDMEYILKKGEIIK